MSISRELIILAVLALVFVILVIALIKSLPRNDSFHKNITRTQSRLITFVILAALVCVACIWIKRLKSSGVGMLFTDADSMQEVVSAISSEEAVADVGSLPEGAAVDILIDHDSISISGKDYTDADKALAAIEEYAKQGRTFTVTDQYASADRVKQVLDTLKSNGIEIEDEDVIVE